MLRVSVEEKTDEIVVRLEGKLSGPWVHELQELWNHLEPAQKGRPIVIDLQPTNYIDDLGKRLLSQMYQKGARFQATGLLMGEVVARIHSASVSIAKLGVGLPDRRLTKSNPLQATAEQETVRRLMQNANDVKSGAVLPGTEQHSQISNGVSQKALQRHQRRHREQEMWKPLNLTAPRSTKDQHNRQVAPRSNPATK
jgi:hypothetical protein